MIMATKTILKVALAFGVLAIVLVFLGVNYVPRIFAASSANNRQVNSIVQARPNYNNEIYPRAILIQQSYLGSDWIERHPSNYYAFSDWVERHP
jgi:hypothetical protein